MGGGGCVGGGRGRRGVGARFLPRAEEFLERAAELAGVFSEERGPRGVHVVASQYLIAYVLIDAVRRFHRAFPDIRVKLSARTELEIEEALVGSMEFSFGVAAPYEASPGPSARRRSA